MSLSAMTSSLEKAIHEEKEAQATAGLIKAKLESMSLEIDRRMRILRLMCAPLSLSSPASVALGPQR